MPSARNFGRVRFAVHHVGRVLPPLLGVGLLSLASCFTSAEGVPPPLKEFYYPTGMVVSPGRTTLYVTNSDFDLQYSGGTVQALDLEALRKKTQALRLALNANSTSEKPLEISKVCAAQSLKANDNAALYPGPCSPVTVPTFVKASVEIGAFASAAALAVRPCQDGRGVRLFVPVRGDPSVTYFDVTDDRSGICDTTGNMLAPVSPCADPTACLSCGAETNSGRCATSHLLGKDPTTSQRELLLPVDPFGIDVDDRGEALTVTHQTQQTASLLVNRWDRVQPDGSTVPGVPALEYAMSSLSAGPTDIAALPIPLLVEENHRKADAKAIDESLRIDYTPAFGVSYRSSPEFTLIRYEKDDGSTPPRPFLTRGVTSRPATTAGSTAATEDYRGLAIDGSERRTCEHACGTANRETCLRSCAENHPLGVYIAHRGPAALVVGRIETKFTEGEDANGEVKVTGAYEIPSFFDSVPLAFGSSRVELGYVVNAKGHLSRRVFAVTFDSRFVFSYDPEAQRIDAIIRTGRGPHAVAFDSGEEMGDDGQMHPYSTMYVAHFTDSYVGVVDLDMNNRTTFGSIYMTLGKPVPPKGSQ